MERKHMAIVFGAGAALLVALAGYFAYDYFVVGGANQVYTSPAWQGLSDEEREKKLDEEERKRRAMGRGPSRRRLPEDPPEGPPKAKPSKTGPRPPPPGKKTKP